jgi:hypothetical protein
VLALSADARYQDLVARFDTVKTQARDQLSTLFSQEGSDRASKRFVRGWEAIPDGGESVAQYGLNDD